MIQANINDDNFLFYILYFGLAACGILVPGPGIKPAPPAVEMQSLNHWTTREVPSMDVQSRGEILMRSRTFA